MSGKLKPKLLNEPIIMVVAHIVKTLPTQENDSFSFVSTFPLTSMQNGKLFDDDGRKYAINSQSRFSHLSNEQFIRLILRNDSVLLVETIIDSAAGPRNWDTV